MRLWLTTFILVCLSANAMNEPAARVLGFKELFSLAEKASPELQVGKARVKQEEASVRIADSRYFPTLSFAAVDSFGMAGAPGEPGGFQGLVGSPFRVGPGVGLLSKYALFDLGRGHDADAAREAHRTSEREMEIIRAELDEKVLGKYLEAARYRGEWEVWQEVSQEIDSVEKRVKGFVQNGQYNDVARLLIDDQAEEARLKVASLQTKYEMALKELSAYLGTEGGAFSCPSASSLGEADLSFLSDGEQSPFVAEAEAETKVAQAKASRFSAEYYPKLFAVGSVGYLSDQRLVPRNNYSVWLGLSLPLFDGFLISGQVERADAVVLEKENRRKAVALEIREKNLQYEKLIRVAREELTLLEHQDSNASHALNLAKSRYLSFLGTLVDLREAIRNKVRIGTQINEAKADLLLALGSKTFLNGGGRAKP